jgi:virulence-associated protein VagC
MSVQAVRLPSELFLPPVESFLAHDTHASAATTRQAAAGRTQAVAFPQLRNHTGTALVL